MDIDIIIGDKSLNVSLENAFRFDAEKLMQKVNDFSRSLGTDISGLRIEKLIPRMIKGVAGCENEFCKRGFWEFQSFICRRRDIESRAAA